MTVASSTSYRRNKMAQSVMTTALAGFLSLVVVIPMFWVLSTSFKTRKEVVSDPLGPPPVIRWENYPEAWDTGKFGLYFKNSIFVAVPTVLGVLTFSMLAAYSFALYQFPGKNVLFVLFLIGLTIPLGVLVIPLYYEMLDLKLLDTHWAIILPQIAIVLPFGILLLRSFIQEIPGEILDAALVDGCNHFTLMIHIVLPLTRPALLTLLVFDFMWSWNEFLLPVVLLQSESARTLPLGLSFFRGRFSTDFPLLMAGATISFLPIIIVYFLFQRQFIKGITAGALSGQ